MADQSQPTLEALAGEDQIRQPGNQQLYVLIRGHSVALTNEDLSNLVRKVLIKLRVSNALTAKRSRQTAQACRSAARLPWDRIRRLVTQRSRRAATLDSVS